MSLISIANHFITWLQKEIVLPLDFQCFRHCMRCHCYVLMSKANAIIKMPIMCLAAFQMLSIWNSWRQFETGKCDLVTHIIYDVQIEY